MFYLLLLLVSCIPKVNELEKTGMVLVRELVIVCKSKEAESCMVGLNSVVGSATRIKWEDEYYWLTAGHVCSGTKDLPEVKRVEKAILVREAGTGETSPAEEILVNEEKDLCLLSAQPGPYRSLAYSEPELGSMVQTIAYPGGAFDPNILPLYDGRWAGKMSGEEKCIVTLPVAGGSSGASILDQRGNVVGVVSSVMKEFNHFTLATCLDDISEFLTKASHQKK